MNLTGDPPESYIGMSVYDFGCTKKIIKEFTKGFDECCRMRIPTVVEIDLMTGKLSGFSFQISFIPIPRNNIKGEEPIGVFSTMRDITQEKKLLAAQEEKIEEQRVLSQRIINKANKLQNFSYIVSHNLRSPVASLVGLMDLYEHAQSDLEHEQIITMFRTSVERLNETVEDLSEIIKINQNINIKLEEIEFDEMLKLVEESIALRINETGAIIHRDFRACKRLVYNKAYLESILLNLITNAIKYKHPNRCPKIEILSWRSGSDVMISCRDNGIGIDLEKHGSKIFGLHKTFHGNQDARGVGLFITKNQVEALDGSIEVESKIGEGTTFHIRFSQKFD
jgi:signal transduction histidine kinase